MPAGSFSSSHHLETIMASIYDIYETDTGLENAGVKVKLTENESVTVAAFGNEKHLKMLDKLKKPLKQQYRHDRVDPKVDEDIHITAMAHHVLIGWDGIKDREGKDLPYSPENAIKLLSDPRMKRFKATILEIATTAETFKRVEKEEEAKNSVTVSGGNSTGAAEVN